MKKLYMKQKVFSFRDRFTIFDEYENDVYYAVGSVFSFSKTLTIYDLQDNEVARIEQKLFSFLPKFTLYIHGQEVATIEQKMSFLKSKFNINGLDIEVEGNFLGMSFDLIKQNQFIGSVDKHWFTWGDSYEITIEDAEDELVVVGLVLAIDFILHEANSSTSSND